VLATTLLAACDAGPGPGPPDQLSQRDSTSLAKARRGLGAVLKSEAGLRTSPEAARRQRAKVQAIVSEGAFETEKLDEFGLAALGRLRVVAPFLVEVDPDGVPVSLDIPATRAFLRFADRDPARALVGPAERLVSAIERTLERSEAGPETRILPEDETASLDLRVDDYLRETEGELRPIWPVLSRRLQAIREGL